MVICSWSPFSPDGRWSANISKFISDVPIVTFEGLFKQVQR